MNTPGSVLIGVLAMGFGALLVFGGIKNKRIFGDNGIVPTALSKGTLADLSLVPAMWGPQAIGRRRGDDGAIGRN